MAAFQSGFQLGTAAFGQGQRMALAQEELAMSKERDARAKELHGLNVAALNRTAGREAEQDRITGQIRDYTTGLQRPETNAALDADFNAADQASMQGLKLPAVRGGSNMANQEALAVRKPVDVNSPEYRSGLAGLRQQFALTKGDMADFDRVGEAERKRFTDKDDADYALEIHKNPNGPAAKQARSFVNAQSKKLSSKADPKTGMTTFALVKGDGYDEINVSPVDLSKVAVGFRRIERGDVGGLDVIAAVNKDLAAAVREELKIDVELGKTNNDANYKTGTLAKQQEELRLKGEELGIKRGQANATAQYYKDRGNMDRMGATSYFTGTDGNTYASVPTMGKNGPTFQTVRVNPEGVKMTKVGSGADMKPADVKEEGTKVTIGGKLQYADGLGGYVPAGPNGKPAGVLPSERQAALKKAGVPDNVIDRVEWNSAGTAVAINGMRFDLNELKNIKTEYERLGKNEIIAEEDRKRSLGMHSALNRMRNAPPVPESTSGFGPTINYRPAPNAPSIYAGPEEWEAYRRFQQTR
jgi:hypothetical protein